MFEVLAIFLGALAGWLVVRAHGSLWVAALCGALAGMTVTAVSGELEFGPGFLFFDAGQAALAAVLSGILARLTIADPNRGQT